VALLAVLLVRLAWRVNRWWQWIPLVLIAALGAAPTWFARQNHFEWMFNPLPDPVYAPATLVDFVDDGDRTFNVTLTLNAARTELTVTFGSDSGTGKLRNGNSATATMQWTPDADIRDDGDKLINTAQVTESGGSDQDF